MYWYGVDVVPTAHSIPVETVTRGIGGSDLESAFRLSVFFVFKRQQYRQYSHVFVRASAHLPPFDQDKGVRFVVCGYRLAGGRGRRSVTRPSKVNLPPAACVTHEPLVLILFFMVCMRVIMKGRLNR